MFKVSLKDEDHLTKMTNEELYDYYINLVSHLKKLDVAYYQDSEPLVSDQEYDILFEALKLIEIEIKYRGLPILEESQTQKLTKIEVQDKFEKALHILPLLSLNKCTTEKEMKLMFSSIEKGLSKVNKSLTKETLNNYCIEPKFDGLTIELVYKDGKLVEASTRGDGYEGDNVFLNALQISNPYLPKDLLQKKGNDFLKGKELRLRGEVIMNKDIFRKLKDKLGLSNARNASSGSLKQLDSNITKERELSCFCYDINYFGKIVSDEEKETLKFDEIEKYNEIIETFKTQENVHNFLFSNGFIKFDSETLTKEQLISKLLGEGKDEARNYLQESNTEMDGYVIKHNNLLSRKLGYTGHHVKYAFAFKFQSNIFETTLLNVQWQIGKTGILTPVGLVKDINIDGVIVSRVTMHNYDQIIEKGFKIGDEVFIQRSGEVIPYLVGVKLEGRENKQLQEIGEPKKCPVCGSEIVKKVNKRKNSTTFYCENDSCSGKIISKIEYFVGKDGMNIEGVGISIIKELVEKNYINKFSDLYTVFSDQKLIDEIKEKITGFGDKKIKNIKISLEGSKNNEISRLICSLGVDGIGTKNAKLIQRWIIEEKLKNSDKEETKKYIQNFSSNDLIDWISNTEHYGDKEGFGEILTRNLKNISTNTNFINTLKELEQVGIAFNNFGKDITILSEDENNNNVETKKSFSITGVFTEKRKDITERLEGMGYVFHEKPTKNTEIMFVGEKAGSKLKKAESLGLKIYFGDEGVEEFLNNEK